MLIPFGGIAFGTVFGTREHQGDQSIRVGGMTFVHPREQIHVGFSILLCSRQSFNELPQQQLLTLSSFADDGKHGARVIFQEIDPGTFIFVSGFFHRGRFFGSLGVNSFQAAFISLPISLQGKKTSRPGLEMHMIGRRSSASCSIIEYDVVIQLRSDATKRRIIAIHRLGRVPATGDGQMMGQDGKRIDQDIVLSLHGQCNLLCRTMIVAQETGSFFERFAIDFRGGRNETCGIVLHGERVILRLQGLCPHVVVQIFKSLARTFPTLQLFLKESIDLFLHNGVLPLCVQSATGSQLQCSQFILVFVVAIHALHVKCSVGISFPTSAQI